MAYSKEYLDALLSRVDIIDVIERSVPLKKKGADYYGLCPFHSEKIPSFTVTPTKQFYHCFGCGMHGNAIRFLLETGYSFPEVVNLLAKRYKFFPRQWKSRQRKGLIGKK